jgi:uncharacterized protein YjbI with pentapeptide repeats
MGWDTYWAIFSQTHPVTLDSAQMLFPDNAWSRSYKNTTFCNADFQIAGGEKADFQIADLKKVSFQMVILKKVDFQNASLKKVNFQIAV